MAATEIPELRIRRLNSAPLNAAGDYVLYWMIAFRRAISNFSVDRAIVLAEELKKPLVVLEALRCDYPWGSDRLHVFVLQGMRDNYRAFRNTPVCYYPYIERERGAGKGLLEALAARACIVVTDDFPAFFLPRMIEAAGRKLPIAAEAVDSNGLIPIKAADKAFPTAFSFRRFLQKTLPGYLEQFPKKTPLAGAGIPPCPGIPEHIALLWPPTEPRELEEAAETASTLPIDHSVPPAPVRGGAVAAARKLARFISGKLPTYHLLRNHPDEDAASGLSPYLHFGHISAHEIFASIAASENPSLIFPSKAGGQRTGWWQMSEGAEAFLDQLVTWRELGFNMCAMRPDYDRFDSLPEWAKKTLAEHASDPRPEIYSLDRLAAASTGDPVWNAAQRQLLREGIIHNYLRMLWGKKILEWSPSPAEALSAMIELNNRYALDGRDPSSYSGIFWILGRYDRPFGPERPIFGKLRYMSSIAARRKLRMEEYLTGSSPSAPGTA